MLLTGHGDVDMLHYRQDVPTPQPGAGQVLVRVTATAKNNTDRKAREGLYPTRGKEEVTSFAMGSAPTLSFPRIQGTDVVGHIVAVGEGVDAQRVGERGLLDFNLYPDDRRDINLVPDYYGHGADGGFHAYRRLHQPTAFLHADLGIFARGVVFDADGMRTRGRARHVHRGDIGCQRGNGTHDSRRDQDQGA